MKRNEAVRQEVLELDDHQCQICSSDANLRVFQVAEEINGAITLCEKCYERVHTGRLHIERWDRENGILAVTDMESRRIPDEKLWFHRRKLAEELKPIEARLQQLHVIDGNVAADLYRLWKDDAYLALDPEAKSFREYTESRGWDTRRALELVRLYCRALELNIEWPPKMTATDFKRQLKDAGKIKSQSYWYVIFEPSSEPNPVKPLRIIHTDDFDALMDEIAPDEVAVRVGKWIKVSARNGELKTKDGIKIKFDEVGA